MLIEIGRQAKFSNALGNELLQMCLVHSLDFSLGLGWKLNNRADSKNQHEFLPTIFSK